MLQSNEWQEVRCKSFHCRIDDAVKQEAIEVAQLLEPGDIILVGMLTADEDGHLLPHSSQADR